MQLRRMVWHSSREPIQKSRACSPRHASFLYTSLVSRSSLLKAFFATFQMSLRGEAAGLQRGVEHILLEEEPEDAVVGLGVDALLLEGAQLGFVARNQMQPQQL